ncbi:MAG: PRC-barrel domain-containing protein [Sulfitobacter sp.]|nr:PRC-barrel domain-containing protein [Sulfitobacter sp.]
MTKRKTNMMLTASTAAMIAWGGMALAQTATNDEEVMQTEEGTAAATDVAGGQVVVEQKDATVDVTVPEPDVDVMQGQPVVTVQQPQPEITVVVPEPTVRVRQQAPIITVEQAQPQITVRIPEPVVTVRVPNPQVDVATGEPIIDLDQPEPVVRFVRPEPRITIQESQPEIRFEQDEAQVNVAEAEDPQVNIQQEEASIQVEQGEDADVQVTSEDPVVRVTDGGEANIDITQEEAEVVLADFEEDEAGRMTEENRQRYAETAERAPIFNYRAVDLIGRSVSTQRGEEVGEIDNIGRRGDTLVAIIGVGGFLGMGENNVAVPVSQLIPREDEIIVPQMTENQLENMPEYNENEVRILEPNMRLGDDLDMN